MPEQPRTALKPGPEHDEADALQSWLEGTWPTDADGAPYVEASHIRRILAPRTLRERVAARIEAVGVRIGAACVDFAEWLRS